MVALLPYRGGVRERDIQCPITITGLAKLYNAVTQFKIDHEHGNFAQFLQENSKKVCKAALPEWPGWQAYHPKFVARTRKLKEVGERLIPVNEGEDECSVNPPLMRAKGVYEAKVNCALKVSEGLGVGLSFIERYETANHVYDQSNVKKLSAPQVNNFQNLLYLNIQYLASCCTLWTPAPTDESGLHANGAGGGGSEADGGAGGGGSEADGAGSGGSEAEGAGGGGGSDLNRATGNLSILNTAKAPASEGGSGGAEPEDQLQDDQMDICEITKWDHRSGHFPLTDSALQQMKFPEHPRPRYYYAIALLLLMRETRTKMEQKVFEELSQSWLNFWFLEQLTYADLSRRGPPRVGSVSYTDAEIEWCKVRLELLDKDIKDPSARERLGLQPLKRRTVRSNTSIEKERADLMEESSDPPRHSGSGGRDGAAPAHGEIVQAAPPPLTGAITEAPVPPPRKRGRTAATADGNGTKRGRKAFQEGAAQEVESAGGGSTTGGSPTTGRGAGVFKKGVIVSASDGRPLVRGNELRKRFSNNYRSTKNTTLWRGHKLDLGQAFKLACFVHYGPRMPYERSGDFEIRKALFITAAYYSMSPDGHDESDCLNSPEFAEFLNILVATAKQMKYTIMTEGRVFFGDNVFTTHRASQTFQREYLPLLRAFSIITYATQ